MDSIENEPESLDTPTSDEPIIDTDTETTDVVPEVNVNDMTAEEFDTYMEDGVKPEPKVEEPAEEDLDAMYTTQLEDPDAKLDKPILVKFNGTVHKVDSVRELKNLTEKGISLTKKSQDLSEQSKLFDTLKANGYDSDSLMRLVEQENGQPLTEMDDNLVQVDKVANDILQSDYKDDFVKVSNQLPIEVIDELNRNPQMLQAIAVDVKSGLAGSIMPEVNRLMAIQGIPFDEAYNVAGRQYLDTHTKQQVKMDKLNAQPNTTRLTPQSADKAVWEMSSDEFSKYFDKL